MNISIFNSFDAYDLVAYIPCTLFPEQSKKYTRNAEKRKTSNVLWFVNHISSSDRKLLDDFMDFF